MDRLGRVLAIQHGRRPYLHFSQVAVLWGEVRLAWDIGRNVPVANKREFNRIQCSDPRERLNLL